MCPACAESSEWKMRLQTSFEIARCFAVVCLTASMKAARLESSKRYSKPGEQRSD